MRRNNLSPGVYSQEGARFLTAKELEVWYAAINKAWKEKTPLRTQQLVSRGGHLEKKV